MRRVVFFFLISGLLGYCGVADLREGRVLQSAKLEKEGQALCQDMRNALQSDKFLQISKIYTKGRDSWNSYLIRKFTPVSFAEQTFVAEIGVQNRSIRYQMLDPKGKTIKVIGIENGKTFQEIAANKKFAEDKEAHLYLQSFLDYFYWPHTLCQRDFAYALQSGSSTKQVFISTKDSVPLQEKDQFIVSFLPKNNSVQFVDFTMRSFLQSYRGTLAYSNWKSYQGIALPHSIRVQDSRIDTSYVHEFTFDSFQVIWAKDAN
ncbi:MAG: hypothetical protein AAF518_15845 [Spirochaetota bacterium]